MNRKFQYPSAATLKRLLAATDQFLMLMPWQWMGDREVVAVRDPVSNEIAYCVVMGSAGMYFGMDAMLGDRGLAAYRKTISDRVGKEDVDFLHAKNSLTLLFDDQRQLTSEDKAIYQAVVVGKYPPQFWPQFRRFEPGFFPWLPEERDALFLAICLEQVVDVASRAKYDPKLLGPCDHRTFLSRIPDHVDGKIVWREEFITPEPLERIVRIAPKVNQALLDESFGQVKKSGMTWEADCFFANTPIGKQDERPYFPFCYMVVDNHSGFVLNINLVDEHDHGAGFLDHMCEAVKKNRIAPSAIHVRHPHLVSVFAPLAAFGVQTSVVKKLPMLDYARKEMMKAFGPGGAMQSPKKASHAKTKTVKSGKAVGHVRQVSLGKNAVCQLKITLDNIRPAIWRRIQVRANITLKRLAATILIVMGWDNSHLHQFKIAGKTYSLPADADDGFDDFEDEGTVRLCDFLPEEIKRFVFEYDFGDGWKHSILLEKVLEPVKGEKYPACLAGARSCPPEDCGGPWGYQDFLEAISDSKHPEHDRMKEWIGGDFDPELFDANGADVRLRCVRREEKYFDAE